MRSRPSTPAARRAPSFACLLATLAALLLAAPRAQAQESREALTARLVTELRAQNPEAADAFQQASAAGDRGDFEGAARGFARARELVPGFFHAARRECGVLSELGRRDEALALCREALHAADTPENHVGLALALASRAHGQQPSDDDLGDAAAEVQDAMRLAPSSPFVQGARCEVALERHDLATARDCARALARIEPDQLSTLTMGFLVAANDEEWGDARELLERAHARGMPDAVYRDLSARLAVAMPLPLRVWYVAWPWALGWLVALAVLLAAGALLSAATLAATRNPSVGAAHPSGAEALVRRVYGVVLWACCAFYYASLPLLALVVLGLGGGLLYVCLTQGSFPIKLVLIVLLTVGVTLWSLVKSLLVRGRDEDPGDRVDLARQPRLRAALEEVAARIGTRPVDEVYLTPDVDVAVFERGGLSAQLRGEKRRCLVLGAGVLDGMSALEFKAVLAHEYGHFHNEDTAGGGFALAARRSLLVLAVGLARGGVATWYNPAWLFVRGFYRVFLRVSQGASRLQEILADRWAAHAYGSEAFARGLRHVVERTIRFDAHVQATLDEALPKKRPVANLYAYAPEAGPDEAKVAAALEKALGAQPSPYDSHPAPAERIARARQLAVEDRAEDADREASAWQLFDDREGIERAMTAHVRETLLTKHGAVLLDEPRAPKAA